MKKIKGDFYTKKEAEETMVKISKYCLSAKVVEYTGYGNTLPGMDAGYSGHDNLSSRYLIGVPGFTGFPMTTGIAGIGWSGMSPGWGADLYDYGNVMPEITEYDITVRATLEAEVEDGKYDTVKDRLYRHGAVSVY